MQYLCYYPKANLLKFRILEVLAWAKEPMTSQDIANVLGVNYGKVNCVDSVISNRKENLFYRVYTLYLYIRTYALEVQNQLQSAL